MRTIQLTVIIIQVLSTTTAYNRRIKATVARAAVTIMKIIKAENPQTLKCLNTTNIKGKTLGFTLKGMKRQRNQGLKLSNLMKMRYNQHGLKVLPSSLIQIQLKLRHNKRSQKKKNNR